jgi:hypothetical protein
MEGSSSRSLCLLSSLLPMPSTTSSSASGSNSLRPWTMPSASFSRPRSQRSR